MTELSSLDLTYLAKELQVLKGARFDKIYQWEWNELLFRFRTKEGKKELFISLPGTLHFTEKSRDARQRPPGFCEFLRKRLTNTIINEVYQKDFERILVFDISTKESKVFMVFELFKPGNILLLTKDMEIIQPLMTKSFRDRTVAKGEKYEFPPSRPNPKNISFENFEKILEESKKPLAKSIAVDLGFGGKYADEICVLAGLSSKSKFSDLTKVEKKLIFDSALSVFSKKQNASASETDAYPFVMKSIKTDKEFPSFSEALDSFSGSLEQEEKISVKQMKAQKVVDDMEKRISQLEKDAERNQQIGEFIYTNYQEFSNLLSEAQTVLKEKSVKELKLFLKSKKGFKELKEKDKKAIFEF